MNVIPPPVSENSTSSNETESSGDGNAEEGTGDNRKKRQADGSGDESDSSSANEKKIEEKTITIVEDSECEESTKYDVYIIIIYINWAVFILETKHSHTMFYTFQ